MVLSSAGGVGVALDSVVTQIYTKCPINVRKKNGAVVVPLAQDLPRHSRGHIGRPFDDTAYSENKE